MRQRMSTNTPNNRFRTFARMVSAGSAKRPAAYAIKCGKLTVAEIARLLTKRGLTAEEAITAASKPIDGLKAIWFCYAIAASNNFTTPYDEATARNAKIAIDTLADIKANMATASRKIATAKNNAEVIFKAKNSAPDREAYTDANEYAKAVEGYNMQLFAVRADAVTAEMQKELDEATAAYEKGKAEYTLACVSFDNEYVSAVDARRKGLSPLKQCGEPDTENADK